jgi:hypothetical protein
MRVVVNNVSRRKFSLFRLGAGSSPANLSQKMSDARYSNTGESWSGDSGIRRDP